MSMNLVLTAIIGKASIDVELLQTPTGITFDALNSKTPYKVYLDWVKEKLNKKIYKQEKEKILPLVEEPSVRLKWGMI